MGATDRSREVVTQEIPKVRCPTCRTDKLEHYGTHRGRRYYRCRVCCDGATMDYTTFRVELTDPLKPEVFDPDDKDDGDPEEFDGEEEE